MGKERCAVLRQLTDESCDVRRELPPRRRPVPRAASRRLNRGSRTVPDEEYWLFLMNPPEGERR